jgi:starch-binding outer membrane protein, SusD/RagB family
MKPKFKYILLLILFAGCEDFLEIEPPAKELSPEIVFAEDATATGAVLGLYFYLWDVGYQVAYRTGLSADDLRYVSTDPNRQQYFDNELSPSNSINVEVWNTFFTVINHANTILEGLQASPALTPDVARQLEGETRFIRAFTYFHLVNFYGEVPALLTSDYRVTSVAFRNTTEEIYMMIVDDLTKAKEMLSLEYVTGQRVRANRSAATALLARAYLFIKNWSSAEAEASEVIARTDLYELNTDLTKIGAANNKEAVLQFYPMTPGINTMEGFFFNPLFASFTLSGTFLSPGLVGSFETDDKRLSSWVGTASDGSNYANKYKVVSSQELVEYPTALRLSEQYLIRSEARARFGKPIDALDDLNIVRDRAGLPALVGLDEAALLTAIEQERRVEFFAEGGHRWFDLKRWDRASTVLGPVKGDTWATTDVLYPIPERELLTNPNMTQNVGY